MAGLSTILRFVASHVHHSIGRSNSSNSTPLSLSLEITYTLSLARSLSLSSFPPSHTHSHTHSRSLSHTHNERLSHVLSLTHTCSLSLSHTSDPPPRCRQQRPSAGPRSRLAALQLPPTAALPGNRSGGPSSTRPRPGAPPTPAAYLPLDPRTASNCKMHLQPPGAGCREVE
jgi:hypothetical protein